MPMGGIGGTFTVTQQQASIASASKRLPRRSVSAADQTLINGVQIDATGDIGRSRGREDYLTFPPHIVPPGLLNPAGNVIAVRVLSRGGATLVVSRNLVPQTGLMARTMPARVLGSG
jgi:hypothetical protein